MPRTEQTITPPFPCVYLPERQACSQVLIPHQRLSPWQFGDCLRQGYRRSGGFIYRPQCEGCQACISVRIPVAHFSPSRSQKRSWKKYLGLQANVLPLVLVDAHAELYQRYQHQRHTGGSMDSNNPDDYVDFMLASPVESRLVEFRDAAGTIKMVSLMDFTDDGASAVYTFYDPDDAGLGTYSILWQCAWLRELGGHFLYLGYWIEASAKMRYKQNFQPLEYFQQGAWQSHQVG